MSKKNIYLAALLSALLLASIFFIIKKLYFGPGIEGVISGAGRIDGELVAMNTKYASRVAKIYVEEGQSVKKGDLLAKLDSAELDARIENVDSSINAAKLELESIRIDLGIASSVNSANYSISLDKQQELESQIESARLAMEQDRKDLERMQRLFEQNLTAKRDAELAELKASESKNRYESIKKTKSQLASAALISKANLASTSSLRQKMSAKQKAIEALEASKKELLAAKNEMSLYAPFDGFVMEKIAFEGEVVGAGAVIITLINPAELTLKMYVDTIENGKIKIGDKAVIFLDGEPKKPISAVVSKISQRAQFTPKDVNVKSDRIQRVYAIYLKPTVSAPNLKLGLPALGAVSVGGELPKDSAKLGNL